MEQLIKNAILFISFLVFGLSISIHSVHAKADLNDCYVAEKYLGDYTDTHELTGVFLVDIENAKYIYCKKIK